MPGAAPLCPSSCSPESSSCTLLARCFIPLTHTNPCPNSKERRAQQVWKLAWKGLSKLEETENHEKIMSQEGEPFTLCQEKKKF